eukprot:859693-Amphidinium_carterae.1
MAVRVGLFLLSFGWNLTVNAQSFRSFGSISFLLPLLDVYGSTVHGTPMSRVVLELLSKRAQL